MEIASALWPGAGPFWHPGLCCCANGVASGAADGGGVSGSPPLAARYAVVVTLVVGILWVLMTGQMAWSMEPVRLAMPVFVAPQWSVSAIVSLAIPCLW